MNHDVTDLAFQTDVQILVIPPVHYLIKGSGILVPMNLAFVVI